MSVRVGAAAPVIPVPAYVPGEAEPRHRAWFGSEPALAGVRYPVLADSTLALGHAYGVLADDGSALRATIVIDPAGVVRHVSISDQAVGRSPAETLRVIQALQTGELCPVDWRPGTPTLRLAASPRAAAARPRGRAGAPPPFLGEQPPATARRGV